MAELKVEIISKSKNLPVMNYRSIFHSDMLFRILEKTPGQRPYMAIAYNEEKQLGHLLVTIRRVSNAFPYNLFMQCRAYGEGEYNCVDSIKEDVFRALLNAITRIVRHKLCLYVEFSGISTKMFGYKVLRENGFFPVHSVDVCNSFNNIKPENRLTYKIRKQLVAAKRSGIKVIESTSVSSTNEFLNILKHNSLRRHTTMHISENLFYNLIESGLCKVFNAFENGRIEGGCSCLFSGSSCYLWQIASKKCLHKKRINTMIVWTAMQYAYKNGCKHVSFMDTGLPFRKNRFREYILSFGGEPTASYRWFRCSIKWVNKLLSWFYRE